MTLSTYLIMLPHLVNSATEDLQFFRKDLETNLQIWAMEKLIVDFT